MEIELFCVKLKEEIRAKQRRNFETQAYPKALEYKHENASLWENPIFKRILIKFKLFLSLVLRYKNPSSKHLT